MFHLARSVSVGLVLLAACVCGAAAVAANCPFYTTDVGDFKLTVVSDGAGVVFGLKDLVKDVHPSALQQVEKLHALKGPQKLDFNVVYLDTGAHKILFDVGSAEHFGPDFGKLLENMGKAGLDPKDVDTVVISHAYRDHIGGVLTPDGKIAFPNAKYMMAKVEHDYWTDPSLESAPTKPSGLKVAKKSIKAIKEKLQLFEFGDEILPGITSKALIGQTPGQSGFVLRYSYCKFLPSPLTVVLLQLSVLACCG